MKYINLKNLGLVIMSLLIIAVFGFLGLVIGSNTGVSCASYMPSQPVYASSVIQDATHRFVTDADKTTWTGKQDHAVILDQLSAMAPSTNKMIWVGSGGSLVQNNADTFGIGLLALTNAAAVRSYIGAGSGSGTVTSVGLTSSDFSVSGSPVTSSGNITANLNTSGVGTGTYRGAITVNNKGIVTAAANETINNTVSRSLSNAAGTTNRYTISTTQPALVTYSITMNFSITALVASSASVFLEYSTNGGSSLVTVSQVNTSFNLGLALSGSNDMSLSGYIPANALVRLRPATANATCTYQTGQEVLL